MTGFCGACFLLLHLDFIAFFFWLIWLSPYLMAWFGSEITADRECLSTVWLKKVAKKGGEDEGVKEQEVCMKEEREGR